MHKFARARRRRFLRAATIISPREISFLRKFRRRNNKSIRERPALIIYARIYAYLIKRIYIIGHERPSERAVRASRDKGIHEEAYRFAKNGFAVEYMPD